MARHRAGGLPRARGVQEWILAVLKDRVGDGPLSTAKIAKKVAKASGRRYHPNSVYTALRVLNSHGAIKSTRKGQKKAYEIADSGPRAVTRPRVEDTTRSRTGRPGAVVAKARRLSPESIRLAAGLPETLAPGEILLFPQPDGHILAATNLHGKLVFERHQRANSLLGVDDTGQSDGHASR